MAISTHSKDFDELLLDADTTDTKAKLKELIKLPFVRKYLEYATDDNFITIDVDSVVAKKYGYQRYLSGARLLNGLTMSIIEKVLLTKEVNNHAKLVQFKALSEMLYSDEAAILKAILQKNLISLYPNMTIDLISEVLNETV